MNSHSCYLLRACGAVVAAALALGVHAQQHVEYFVDTEPGIGRGHHLLVSPDASGTLHFDIPFAGLAPGDHLVGIRPYHVTDSATYYAPTLTYVVYVPFPAVQSESAQTRAEFFWDTDPGIGRAAPITAPEGDEASFANFSIAADTLPPGDHLLGLRVWGEEGWGPTLTHVVYVPAIHAEEDLKVLSAEFFWNTDPGYGVGTPIALTPDAEVTLEDFGLPSSDVHGDATLFVRFRGSEGWSPTLSFAVMVDAEGNYTLNASSATDPATRNYQTLADAFADWTERGVGGDITATLPTTSVEYAFDATGDEAVAQMATLATSLADVPSPQAEKVVTFTAAAGSGNTLAIATTADALPTVVSVLAHTALENVALKINGTSYDFSAAAQRHAEVCSGEATTALGLSTLSTALRATWRAMPHEGTVLGGFPAEGAGDLPPMTLTNSGTALDSLAYEVTLADLGGNTVYAYTYIIYVHPRVSEQAFSGLIPVSGSTLDPGPVTLRWNAVGGVVGGYRVEVASRPTADDGSAVVTETFDTETTSHTLTAETGRTYTWTVTAIGRCDELTSPELAFTGRLLPDLVVESIAMPEGAEAGNIVTVKAVVRNTGEGATKETTWTDRLYYTVDSEDFAQAVQAASVSHMGALAVGQSYEASFSLKVPQADAGLLRVFVVADATSAVMEADDTNNRTLSAPATLAPFYMNGTDLAALRQLYADFGGARWNGTPWNTASELITPDNWSGVTFDTEGRVTAINLSRRGLEGSTLRAETLAPLTALITLNLSYNQIDNLTAALPATITSLDLSSQHRTYGSNTSFPGLGALTPQAVAVGTDNTVALTDVTCYDHAAQAFSAHPTLSVYTPQHVAAGTLTWSAMAQCYQYSAGSLKLTLGQDADVVLLVGGSLTGKDTALPARLHFVRGDANLSGFVDVNDVQRTLNYVLNTNNGTAFGLWAANTYAEDETEAVVNIQDIVCTVDIVLGEEQNGVKGTHAPHYSQETRLPHEAPSPNLFFVDGRTVRLSAADEVAAFALELEGVSASQVRLLLNARDWQLSRRNTARGVRLVVFSPTGAMLPAGTTELLRLGGDAVAVAVQATSPAAEDVKADVWADGYTGIGALPSDGGAAATYDLGGRKLDNAHKQRGIYIVNGKKVAK